MEEGRQGVQVPENAVMEERIGKGEEKRGQRFVVKKKWEQKR